MATAVAPSLRNPIVEAERRAIRASFRARERMSVLEWADSRRWLSPEANAMAVEAGAPVRYDSAVTPYHREPMLALSDPRTEYVVCKFPSQDGKTEILNNFIGSQIDLAPGPMLVLQPTKELADAWSKDRLAPMLRDTPVLRGKVRDARARDSDNTILHKKFPGGHLTVTGSNSPAGVSARPIMHVAVDEVDRCARSAGTEGDSIRLAFRRATTFRKGKKFLISSPTIKGDSRIDAEYQLGTQEEWELPCPHCGAYQVIRFGNKESAYGIKWEQDEKGLPILDSIYYLCEFSGCVIEEREKAWMNARGRWVARNPSAGPRVRSFTKNAWSSALASWRKLVAEWDAIQGKPLEIQTFINTVNCELYDPVEGDALDSSTLMQRLEPFPKAEDGETELVPTPVALLVRTVDTQDDRLETAVWGFGDREEAWRVDYEMIPGSTSIPLGAPNSPWNELKDRIRHPYEREGGGRLIPRVTFVDSGGHATSQVYTFTKAMQHMNVYAIKGANTEGAPLLAKPTRNNSQAAILYMVGSFTAKELTFRRFTRIRKPGPGYIHIPDSADATQVAQFTNEKLIARMAGGRWRREWVQTGRCEQFHLLAYAYAALEKLGPRVKRSLASLAHRVAARAERAQKEQAPSEPEEPVGTLEQVVQQARPPRPRRSSGYINGWRR